MVKKQLFYLFYMFFAVYLTILRGKEYFAKEPEPGVFGHLEPERGAARKKYKEPEPLGEKIRSRSRSRLKKNSGAGAAKKFAGSPALLQTANFSVIFHTLS